MKIERSGSERAHFADNVTDAHILSAITDPERVIISQNGNVKRVVGLTLPLHPGKGFVVYHPHSLIVEPSLLDVIYQEVGDRAIVIFAVEADEEELDLWIRG